jgi:hypothetical protein
LFTIKEVVSLSISWFLSVSFRILIECTVILFAASCEGFALCSLRLFYCINRPTHGCQQVEQRLA